MHPAVVRCKRDLGRVQLPDRVKRQVLVHRGFHIPYAEDNRIIIIFSHCPALNAVPRLRYGFRRYIALVKGLTWHRIEIFIPFRWVHPDIDGIHLDSLNVLPLHKRPPFFIRKLKAGGIRHKAVCIGDKYAPVIPGHIIQRYRLRGGKGPYDIHPDIFRQVFPLHHHA